MLAAVLYGDSGKSNIPQIIILNSKSGLLLTFSTDVRISILNSNLRFHSSEVKLPSPFISPEAYPRFTRSDGRWRWRFNALHRFQTPIILSFFLQLRRPDTPKIKFYSVNKIRQWFSQKKGGGENVKSFSFYVRLKTDVKIETIDVNCPIHVFKRAMKSIFKKKDFSFFPRMKQKNLFTETITFHTFVMSRSEFPFFFSCSYFFFFTTFLSTNRRSFFSHPFFASKLFPKISSYFFYV